MQGRRIDRAELLIRNQTPMSGIVTVDEAWTIIHERFYLTSEDEVRWALIRSDKWDRVEPNVYRRVG